MCDFCGCTLAADGAVLRTSDRAKTLARVDERIDRLTEDLAAAKADAQEVRQQLTAAKAELERRPAPRVAADDDDDDD